MKSESQKSAEKRTARPRSAAAMGGNDSGRGDATFKRSNYSPMTSRADSFGLSPPSKSGRFFSSGKKTRTLGTFAILILIIFAIYQSMKGLGRGAISSQTRATTKLPARGGSGGSASGGGNSRQQSSSISSSTQKEAASSSITTRASGTAAVTTASNNSQQQQKGKVDGAATTTAETAAAAAAALEKLATSRGWEGEDIAAGAEDGIGDVEGDGSFADHAVSVAGEHEREGVVLDENALANALAGNNKQGSAAGKAASKEAAERAAAAAALESEAVGGRGWEGENVAASIHEGEEWGDEAAVAAAGADTIQGAEHSSTTTSAAAAVGARSSLDPFTEEKMLEKRERQAFKILDKADQQAILADTRGGSFGSRPKVGEAAAAAAAERIRDWELDGLEEDYFNEGWEGGDAADQKLEERAGPDYEDYDDYTEEEGKSAVQSVVQSAAVRAAIRAREDQEDDDEKEEDYKALDDEGMTTEGNSRARLIPDEFVENEEEEEEEEEGQGIGAVVAVAASRDASKTATSSAAGGGGGGSGGGGNKTVGASTSKSSNASLPQGKGSATATATNKTSAGKKNTGLRRRLMAAVGGEGEARRKVNFKGTHNSTDGDNGR